MQNSKRTAQLGLVGVAVILVGSMSVLLASELRGSHPVHSDQPKPQLVDSTVAQR